MLHRVIYASEAVGATGTSILSIAQILGVSERNNRRDHITSGVMFHDGHILQAIEGGRSDLDRLVRRLLTDPRHTGLRILVDEPIQARKLGEAMSLCDDPNGTMAWLGLSSLSRITPQEANDVLEMKKAA